MTLTPRIILIHRDMTLEELTTFVEQAEHLPGDTIIEFKEQNDNRVEL